jgi:hypothetical protein
MVVHRWCVNFTPTELGNNLCNNFKFLQSESFIQVGGFLMSSHILFRTKVDKAASHVMMFLLWVGLYLSGTSIYWTGTAGSSEFADRSGEFILSYGTIKAPEYKKMLSNLLLTVLQAMWRWIMAYHEACTSLYASMYKRKADTRSKTSHCGINLWTNHCAYTWTTQ